MVNTNVLEVLLLCTVATIGLGEVLRLLLTAILAPWFHDSFSIISMFEHIYADTRKKHAPTGKTKERKGREITVLLSEEQIERIRARKWKEVLAWIAFHPDELLRVDHENRTALHFACLFQAPAQVIEMMLFQAPSMASISNDDHELPLHWAVRLSAPKETIKWLLIVNPSSGCLARDKEGNTPLSLTWERQETTLMNAFWRQRDTIQDNLGWHRVLLFLKAFALSLENRDAPQDLMDIDHTNDLSADLTEPLHLACRCPACPSTLFAFLIVLHRDRLQTQDENGFLPLHNACLDFQSNRSVGALTKIDLLLNEWSEAASIKDNIGRIALHIALEGGVAWDEGVNRLIGIFPKSLHLVDPKTNLLAFALAATERTVNDENDVHSSRQLSLIYNLLRKDPAMIACENRNTRSPPVQQ